MSMSAVIEKVENFINKVHSHPSDIVLEGAGDVGLVFGDYPHEKHRTLAMVLAESMMEYERHRNDDKKIETALDCLKWINEAYAYGVVRDREDIRNKLKDCVNRTTGLERELHQAHQRIAELEGLARLHGIDPTRRGNSLEGDVE